MVKIADNLSGIKKYKGTIDGKWVLFEYDAKRNLLIYTIKDNGNIKKGKHILKLEVIDERKNKSQEEYSLIF